MAKYQRKFILEVMTPDGPVLSTEASSLILPATDGQIGILGGHAPLLAMLGAGIMTLEDTKKNRFQYFLSGGFANVRENVVSVMAEFCTLLDTLDVDSAQSELAVAQQISTDTAESRSRRHEAIGLASAKVRAAQQKYRLSQA